MTAQEVFLARVTVSSSILSCCLWPHSPTGQHTNTGISRAGDKWCSERGAGFVPSGKAASWKVSDESNETL